MKLHYLAGACSLAGHIALEWAGADYTTSAVARDQLKNDFLRINPMGAVPALELDGEVLTQNTAILNFIADSFPAAKLGGERSPRERAEVNRWIGFLASDLHPAFKPMFGATAYLDDADVIARTKAHALAQVRRLLGLVDAHLAGREWLADTRSVADPYLYVQLRWAKKLGVDLADFPALAAFCARMDADAGVQKALAEEGLA